MKIRVTLLTENDKSVSSLGDNPEEKAREGWEFMCTLLNKISKDKAFLEKVEIVE